MNIRPARYRSKCGVFDEIADALRDVVGIEPGRSFGRPCLKHLGRPFVAHDGEVIAFRLGSLAAAAIAEWPDLTYWNPRGHRRPKTSWVVCSVVAREVLADLAARAANHAAQRIHNTGFCDAPPTPLLAEV